MIISDAGERLTFKSHASLVTSLSSHKSHNSRYGCFETEADMQAVVSGSILNGQLPLDPYGIYFVIASSDVNANGLCSTRCEFHNYVNIAGVAAKYAFIGDPQAMPQSMRASI